MNVRHPGRAGRLLRSIRKKIPDALEGRTRDDAEFARWCNGRRHKRHSSVVSVNLSARRGVGFLAQTIAASAAMTVSQRAEMLATRREPSDVPVRVVERLTGASIRGTTARTAVGHLAQGSLAAAAIMLARATRRTPGAPAVVLIATSLVAGDAALVRIVGVAQAPWRWQRRDLAIDAAHKTSLAIAARTIVTRARER